MSCSYEIAIGYNALQGVASPTGTHTDNVAVGNWCGEEIDNGAVYNVFIGYQAGRYHLTGDANVFIGNSAGMGVTLTSTSSYSVGVGSNALFSLTSGDYNVAIGASNLYSLTDQDRNIAIGGSCGYYLNGQNNVLLGNSAGFGITGSSTYSNMIAIGSESAYYATTGTYNIALGYRPLYYNRTGGSNVAIGSQALYGVDSTAINLTANVAIGSQSFQRLPTGASLNVGIGHGVASYITGSWNTFMGENCARGASTQAGPANYNVAIGGYAIYSLDGADQITAIGHSAGRYCSTGDNSVFVGYKAAQGLLGTQLTGNGNVAVGANAGLELQGTATNNVFVGNTAGEKVTTATTCVAIGTYSLRYGADGNSNIAVGYTAINGKTSYTGTTPFSNIGIGYGALSQVDNGASYNVAIGQQAGYYSYGNDYSVFIGYYAGYGSSGTTDNGQSNIAIGQDAFRSYVDADRNIAIGSSALYYMLDGTYNIAIGNNAGYFLNRDATDAGYSNVVIGSSAGQGTATGENDYAECVFVGSNAGLSSKTSNRNVAVGYGTLRQGNKSTYNVALGVECGYYLNENTSADYATRNVFIGYQTGYGVSTTTTETRHNVCIGNMAGKLLDGTSQNNILIGQQAGENYGAGVDYAIGIGYYALNNFAGGTGQNIAIGYSAMRGLSAATKTANYNVAIGRQSLYYADTSDYNVAVGVNSGYRVDTSDSNVMVGYLAAQDLAGGTGQNVVIGNGAGQANGTPGPDYATYDSSVIIGYQAGYALSSGSSNVLIGYKAGNDLTTESDQLRIANDTGGALIEGDFSDEWVKVDGSFAADNQPGRNWVINGNFDVWQRGTSFTSTGTQYDYTADRWVKATNGDSCSVTRESSVRARPMCLTTPGTLLLRQRLIQPELATTRSLQLKLKTCGSSLVKTRCFRFMSRATGALTTSELKQRNNLVRAGQPR